MEKFDPSKKIEVEDLDSQGTLEDGTLVFGNDPKIETFPEMILPEIKNLIQTIETKGVSLGDLLMLKREITTLVGNGITPEIIARSIEDVLVEAYKNEIVKIDNSFSGEVLKNRIKEELLSIGVAPEKLKL